ncbi:MAG: hypothetical protein KDG89_02900 [Geminicoccaceae bacterium]|nr:hypothetical protein [Geminicoccaceae bacterium]
MSAHPIVALWSHPRSTSTAFERVMRARGDMDCLHEPFMYDYYVHRKCRVMPHFEVQEGHPVAYEAIRDSILGRAEARPVFFKDMSYYVVPRIVEDEAFSCRIGNCFLIRDPQAAIASYFKLDPDVTCEEIGIEAQWRHFDALRATTGKAPLVLRSEDVRRDPRGTIGALWAAFGLDFVPGAFEWDGGTPADWAQVEGWHGDVAASRSIRPLTEADLLAQARDFRDLAERHPNMRRYLDHHRPFHERLQAFASQGRTAFS